MPVSDKEYLLANGLEISSTADGAGKYVGIGPIQGMKAYLHADSVTGSSPTLDIKLQESDSFATGYTDVPGGAFTQLGDISAPVYDEIHIHWTKRYLRYSATVGGTTPVYAGVVIGLTPGQLATT